MDLKVKLLVITFYGNTNLNSRWSSSTFIQRFRSIFQKPRITNYVVCVIQDGKYWFLPGDAAELAAMGLKLQSAKHAIGPRGETNFMDRHRFTDSLKIRDAT